jgi:hypothetical protein
MAMPGAIDPKTDTAAQPDDHAERDGRNETTAAYANDAEAGGLSSSLPGWLNGAMGQPDSSLAPAQPARLQELQLSSASAEDPLAVPVKKSDGEVNGHVIGQGGKIYDPDKTDLDDIPSIKPDNGRQPNGETVVFVNGISNTQTQAYEAAQRLANTTGAEVRVLYNATRGEVADYTRGAVGDGWLTDNRSVRNLSDLIYKAGRSGQALHVVATSNGAAITKDALHKAQDRLFSDNNRGTGLWGSESKGRAAAAEKTQQQLGKVDVETFGPVVDSFAGVKGPRYLHFLNKQDSASIAELRRPLERPFNDDVQLGNAGLNARVIRIDSNRVPGDPHGGHYLETYLPARLGTFDKVYGAHPTGRFNDQR